MEPIDHPLLLAIHARDPAQVEAYLRRSNDDPTPVLNNAARLALELNDLELLGQFLKTDNVPFHRAMLNECLGDQHAAAAMDLVLSCDCITPKHLDDAARWCVLRTPSEVLAVFLPHYLRLGATQEKLEKLVEAAAIDNNIKSCEALIAASPDSAAAHTWCLVVSMATESEEVFAHFFTPPQVPLMACRMVQEGYGEAADIWVPYLSLEECRKLHAIAQAKGETMPKLEAAIQAQTLQDITPTPAAGKSSPRL